MPVKVGIFGCAHMHVWAYANGLKSNSKGVIVGVWDGDPARAEKFARAADIKCHARIEALLSQCDAVFITSENSRHAELAEAAANAGKHILCEKPLVISEEQGRRMLKAVENSGVKLMTAFPCRFSPSYQRLKQRVHAGEIGNIRAICGTNRGRCPFGWFVEADKSGGGAMIDHVVHVTDLMRDLLGEEPESVQAQIGHNMYGQSWEDTAMLTIQFPNGVFATLDSSWSRPSSYKTWGGVTMNVVGDEGVIEMDMFNQTIDRFSNETNTHTLSGYGSDADSAMVDAFLNCVIEDDAPPVSGWDGLQAARVALAGYESVRKGKPILVSSDRP